MGSYDDNQFDVRPQRDDILLGGQNKGYSVPGLGLPKPIKKNGTKDGDLSLNKNPNPNQRVEVEYEGYYLQRVQPSHCDERPDWSRVSRTKLPFNDTRLADISRKQRSSARQNALDEFEALTRDQQGVVTRLVDTIQALEKNPNATWSLVCLRKDIERNRRRGTKETKKILVILKREPRSTARNGIGSAAKGTTAYMYRDTDIIDLNDPLPKAKPLKSNDVHLGGNLRDIHDSFPGIQDDFRGINSDFRGVNDGFRGVNDNFRGGFDDPFLGGNHDNFRGMNDGVRGINENIRGMNDNFHDNHDNAEPGFGLNFDNIVPGGVKGGNGKKKGNKKNKGPGQAPERQDSMFANVGDTFLDEPQIAGPFPDPFRPASVNEKRIPVPPVHQDIHGGGHQNQQHFPQQNHQQPIHPQQQHAQQGGLHPQPAAHQVPKQQPGPQPIPVGAIPAPARSVPGVGLREPLQPQFQQQQPHQPPMHEIPRQQGPMPNQGHPFQPDPQFNHAGIHDLPPTLLNNDPRFGAPRERPLSPPRKRSISARRPAKDFVDYRPDDRAFLDKVNRWDINDTHSSDDSLRDDMWSARDRDSRHSFTPPSSPPRSDYAMGSLGRTRSYHKHVRRGSDREHGYPLDRDREIIVMPHDSRDRRGRHRNSPTRYLVEAPRTKPRAILHPIQRSATTMDYPSVERERIVVKRRPRSRYLEDDMYDRGRRGGGRYEREREEVRYYDDRDRGRRGGRRATGIW